MYEQILQKKTIQELHKTNITSNITFTRDFIKIDPKWGRLV
jgi:hypothetical protein